MRLSRAKTYVYFRNFVFGIEDGLVSTVGLLSGIAIAGVARETIILTGVILIFVEGFSMAVGSFLSESSEEEYRAQAEVKSERAIASGVVMFISYVVAGCIPLLPYVFLPGTSALTFSVVASLVALCMLGAFGGLLSHTGVVKRALRMTFVGGAAVLIGVFAGIFLR